MQTIIRIALLSFFILNFLGCTKCPEDIICMEPLIEDYRIAFIGTYDCTKSSLSFEDDMFTTPLEVVVQIDEDSDSLLLVNDLKMPVNENGEFGLAEFEDHYFELRISDNEFKLTFGIVFHLGDSKLCYLQGKKQ